MARKRGRRKKQKIRVDLDLPKDDKTRQRFLAITISTSIIGMVFLGFWAMNADFISQPANGNPMFVNTMCNALGAQGFDSNLPPEYADNESCWLTKERPSGISKRSIKLPVSVDSHNVSSTYRNGVLEIVLPKHDQYQVKQIAIN